MEYTQNWKKISESVDAIDFNEKGIALLEIEKRKICIIKTPDGIKACADRCPHAGSSLSSNGFIDHHLNIVCCTHNYKFNLRSGRDSMNEGYFLKLFPVKVDEDGVFIEM